MSRLLLTVVILFLLTISGGCHKNDTKLAVISPTVNPISQEAIITPEETVSLTPTGKNTKGLELADYFPIQADTEYVYTGEGNEFASYTVYTDYMDTTAGKMQTRTDNGGTQTVRVIEIRDGKVSIVYKAKECYYRDSFMNKATSDDAEILLMEPLVKGTKWTLSDGRQRYISSVDKVVDTPLGSYHTIEVTTQESEGTNKDYYAPQMGLVKSVYDMGDLQVSSTLKEVNSNTPLRQLIDVNYPDTNKKIRIKPLTVTFRTNDNTGDVLVKALRKEANKERHLPLVGDDTVINSLYLGEDKIVYVDFSSDLIKDMKSEADYEAIILQCITNTLGNYYGVHKVCITVDKKPYNSTNIKKKAGETFRVNMDLVVQ